MESPKRKPPLLGALLREYFDYPAHETARHYLSARRLPAFEWCATITQAHPNINIVSFGLAGAAPLAAPRAIARATAQSILFTDFSLDSQ